MAGWEFLESLVDAAAQVETARVQSGMTQAPARQEAVVTAAPVPAQPQAAAGSANAGGMAGVPTGVWVAGAAALGVLVLVIALR